MYIYILIAKTQMSDDLKGAIITALITGIISIIGFIITNTSMKKSFKNELTKQRDGMALEKMSTIPYDTLSLYEDMMSAGKIDKNLKVLKEKTSLTTTELIEKKKLENKRAEYDTELLKKMQSIYNTIYAYGSVSAIKIVSAMQSTNYKLNENSTELEKLEIMAYLILLSSQVKQDVTSITINPKYWLEMRITDYHTNFEKINSIINQLVDKLKLNNEFKII